VLIDDHLPDEDLATDAPNFMNVACHELEFRKSEARVAVDVEVGECPLI